MKKKWTKEQRTAYHEAGHAVMCYLLRQRFSYVTIVPDQDCWGKVHTTFTKNYWKDIEWAPSPAKAEKEIRIFLAGVVAEAIATGRRDWKLAGNDLHYAVDFAMRMIGTAHTAGKYIEYLLSSVRDTLSLSHHKRMVLELAEALLKEKTIGYRKARTIMRQAMQQEIQDEICKQGKVTVK